MTYQLRVRFKSNEHPWSGTDTPLKGHQPKDEEAAIKWARGMAHGLGPEYDVDLYEDDKRVDILPESE